MCGVLHNSQWRALFVGTSANVYHPWILHHLQKHVCCILMSQLPQPFNYLLSHPNSLTMLPIWPFPNFISRAPFICCHSKFFLQAFNPSSFLSPSHVFGTNKGNDLWHLYKLTRLSWQYKCSFQGVLYGICMTKGYCNLWHQLAYKAWETKNWLTIMSYSSFKL
jgi:hypothetical protein